MCNNGSNINFYKLDCMQEYIKEDEKLKYILDKKVEQEEIECKKNG